MRKVSSASVGARRGRGRGDGRAWGRRAWWPGRAGPGLTRIWGPRRAFSFCSLFFSSFRAWMRSFCSAKRLARLLSRAIMASSPSSSSSSISLSAPPWGLWGGGQKAEVSPSSCRRSRGTGAGGKEDGAGRDGAHSAAPSRPAAPPSAAPGSPGPRPRVSVLLVAVVLRSPPHSPEPLLPLLSSPSELLSCGWAVCHASPRPTRCPPAPCPLLTSTSTPPAAAAPRCVCHHHVVVLVLALLRVQHLWGSPRWPSCLLSLLPHHPLRPRDLLQLPSFPSHPVLAKVPISGRKMEPGKSHSSSVLEGHI